LQSPRTSLLAGANVLFGQISHCAAPSAEYVFTPHSVHCSDDTAPGVDDLNPAPHLEHVVAPSCELYDPALQIWHVAFGAPRWFVRNPLRQWQSDCRVLPISDVELPWHAKHTLLDVAASTDEYVLFPHRVQVLGPTVGLYVPSTHEVHTAPFAPVYPALHRQSLASSLPAGACAKDGQLEHVETTCATVPEYSFAAQSVHVPMPTAVLYFPAPHAAHATPFAAPEYPALHWQSVWSALPGNANVLAGQSMHRLSPIAPVPVRYLPAMQFTQALPPNKLLYLPAGHATHPTPGNTSHTVLKGVYFCSSRETLCISMSFR
jgi:hypothetical protein